MAAFSVEHKTQNTIQFMCARYSISVSQLEMQFQRSNRTRSTLQRVFKGCDLVVKWSEVRASCMALMMSDEICSNEINCCQCHSITHFFRQNFCFFFVFLNMFVFHQFINRSSVQSLLSPFNFLLLQNKNEQKMCSRFCHINRLEKEISACWHLVNVSLGDATSAMHFRWY